MYGEKMIIANATGCSSIFGGNLPTTPWTVNDEGRGPAWANSLFEDNAEFGLGIKLATDKKRELATYLLNKMKDKVGADLSEAIINTKETDEKAIQLQRHQIATLKDKLKEIGTPEAKNLFELADYLSEKSIWIVGGDGWAYDIGFSGLDHVLSTGENVNILVLDTEVYSNTGGQKSKASPLGASAKFSINGKTTGKKDLAWQAIAHENAYVAQIAIGANDAQTVRILREAEAYPGPSIVIAYSHCIAHGYDMCMGPTHQQNAVKTGYWPLFHYNPSKPKGERFVLDSKEPSLPLSVFLDGETRFTVVKTKDPELALSFMNHASEEIKDRWSRLEMLKGM